MVADTIKKKRCPVVEQRLAKKDEVTDEATDEAQAITDDCADDSADDSADAA